MTRLRIFVLGGVNIEAKASGFVDYACSQHGALLADAAGKDKSINLAVEGDKVCTDIAKDTVNKNIKCKPAFFGKTITILMQ